MIFLILYSWPWKQMKSIRAEFLYMSFPAPWRSLSTPLDPQLPTGPAVQLLLTPAATRITDHYLLPCVTTITPGVLRPINAELCVPGRETSSLAGGCSYPTCRALYLISFNLSTGFPEFKEISHWLWCLFSCSKIMLKNSRKRCITWEYWRWQRNWGFSKGNKIIFHSSLQSKVEDRRDF